MRKIYLPAVCLLAGLLVVPLAAAQEQEEEESNPIIWVSFVKAQRGKSTALTQNIAQTDGPIFDQLMADGKLLGWGVGQPINHWPGDDWTHAQWATFPGWEQVNEFIGAFMATQATKSEEEKKAQQEEWESLVVAGSHYDAVNRSLILEPGGSTQRPTYLNIAFYKAQPGQAGELQKIFEEHGVPVLKKLQDEDVIGGFGLYTAELHGDYSWSHVVWYMMPGLGARDAVREALEAAEAARSEEENKAMMERFEKVFVPEAHQDRILVLTHLGGAPAEE